MCIPPLYHTGAKMHWFGNFIVGARGVILKGIKPEFILQAISEEKITIVWLLVPWAHDILIAIENREVNIEDYELDQWRLMHMGAQPIPPSLINNWKKIFPHHEYDTNYGLTETTGPGCVHLGLENTAKVGAIGVPGFDWECRIVDFELKPLPQGEPGELLVRGPGVMKEYYKNPEATAATLKDGWLLTGDIARIDEDGFIWLVDRAKDIIITGGENIFPVEIESHIMGHPKVQDVGVIGLPDERLVEIVAAIIKGQAQSNPDGRRSRRLLSRAAKIQKAQKNHFRRSSPKPHRQNRKTEIEKNIYGNQPKKSDDRNRGQHHHIPACRKRSAKGAPRFR